MEQKCKQQEPKAAAMEKETVGTSPFLKEDQLSCSTDERNSLQEHSQAHSVPVLEMTKAILASYLAVMRVSAIGFWICTK